MKKTRYFFAEKFSIEVNDLENYISKSVLFLKLWLTPKFAPGNAFLSL